MKFKFIKRKYLIGLLKEAKEGPKLTLGPYSEDDSGFCRYNKKINEYAISAPENMAEVLIFVVSSQLVDWPNIYTKFPHLINWIYAHNGMYPKDAKIVDKKLVGGFPSTFNSIVLGEKAKSINAIWKDRDNVFKTLAPVIRKYNNMKEGEQKEEAAFELYQNVLKLRHHKIPKGGFAVQLLIGRYGCIDSVNLNVLPVPEDLLDKDDKGQPKIKDFGKTYSTDPMGPSPSAFGSTAKPDPSSAYGILGKNAEDLARMYKDYLLEIGKLAKDNESKILWDKWCDIVAHKINFAGTEFDVEDTEGIYSGRISSDYARNYDPTTPPATYAYGVRNPTATGPEISRQHADLLRGLKGIQERKKMNIKQMILEELSKILSEKAFAGKKELDNDEDGVPKWADKDDSDSKVGSKSSKKKGGKVPPQLQKHVKSKETEEEEELDEVSAASGMGMGYAAPLGHKKKVIEEDDAIVEYLTEAEAKKKNPPLGKVTRNPAGSNKKFHVYVKCGGRVKKISFGDPGLSIKRDSPERRKNFRARHKCDKPEGKNRCTARYWSCYQWRAGKRVEGE
jgi:hypothetical protein